MRLRAPVHGPTLRGRLRTDRGLLVLTGLVVAVTAALLAAVGPLTVQTADRAVAAQVRTSGPGGAVVATLPSPLYRGLRDRDPTSVDRFEQDTAYARSQVPARLRAVVRPGVASLVSPPLALRGAGPEGSVRLAYLQARSGPAVDWVAGSPPLATGDDADVSLPYDAPPWPVQAGLSQRAAEALGVTPGDTLSAEDDLGTVVSVVVSGVYTVEDPLDAAWRASPELVRPSVSLRDGVEHTSVGALVTDASLPDLRIAVPSDELTHRVTFLPVPERVGWRAAPALRREVVELKASPGLVRDQIGWDGLLDRVLDDAVAQVATARGQAQVLLVGLIASALLTLLLAAQLLVRRRAGSLRLARERGATLPGVAVELGCESLLVSLLGAAAGVGLTTALVGSADWVRVVPLAVGATLAAPVLGALEAARATDVRRVPANLAARRTAERRRRVRRLALEAAVLVLAVLSLTALRQRGTRDGDLTAASAATWCSVAGALVLVRLLPPAARLALRAARRTTGRVRFVVAARVAESGGRGLPLLVVAVAVAQLVLGGALAATEREGQEAGALLSVGGDARLTTAPDRSVATAASDVAGAPGVEAAVAALVEDGVSASAADTGADVVLVVVDAAGWERLRAASALPDAPQLDRLDDQRSDGRVPALLVGGTAGLADQLAVRRGDDAPVPLAVVGTAPRVDASDEPVVVVDRAAFAAAGADAEPDTVWAVGPGAAAALRAVADGASVTTYAEVLSSRRDAPLASALVHLALASALLLLLLAALGVLLGAAADAPARSASLGRLRSLGLRERELTGVLAGELLVPVLASVLTGLVIGTACALAVFDSLGLDLVTGGSGPPPVVVPWWSLLALVALLATALLLARREGVAMRRASLARLLRSGDPR